VFSETFNTSTQEIEEAIVLLAVTKKSDLSLCSG
jgi:hypothetical protein